MIPVRERGPGSARRGGSRVDFCAWPHPAPTSTAAPSSGGSWRTCPPSPGCYLYRDEEGNLLYVGKAKVLRNRVKSYFQAKQLDAKTRRLVARIWDLEFIVCETELEALVLENNLIKEHRPPYNILLRDDKSYPYVKLTWKDAFPQVFVTRKVKKDGSPLLRPLLPRLHRLPHGGAGLPLLPDPGLRHRHRRQARPGLPEVPAAPLHRPLHRRREPGGLPGAGQGGAAVPGGQAGRAEGPPGGGHVAGRRGTAPSSRPPSTGTPCSSWTPGSTARRPPPWTRRTRTSTAAPCWTAGPACTAW